MAIFVQCSFCGEDNAIKCRECHEYVCNKCPCFCVEDD